MIKERQTKILSIVALIIAIVGMTLGFAAFSTTLNISSGATVTPNSEDFNIIISGSSTDLGVKEIVPVVTGGVSAENAIINEYGITTGEILFTAPGQKVTFYDYAHNIGKYDGYVKTITFKKVDGYDKNVVCIPDDGTSDELVQEACKGIVISYLHYVSGNPGYFYEHSSDYVGSTKLPKNSVVPSGFSVQYKESAARADGPFTVLFGDVVYDISTVE